MKNPFITVIIPVYKVEKYLRKCLDSVIDQDYPYLEIILVDDESPDSSGAICDEYAKKDNRIKVIHKLNGGLSDARNAAMEISTGEFLTFVDSDDYISEDYISTLVNLSQKYNADITISPFIDVKLGNEIEKTAQSVIETSYSKEEALNTMFYQKDFDNNATSKLFKKKIFLDVTFPKGLLYEDLATTYKLISKSDRVAFTNKHNYNYLLREDSIEGSPFNQKKFDSLIQIIRELETFKITNPRISKAVDCRILSFLFHLLFETVKDSKYEQDIFSLVKKYRLKVLKDINARKKTIISAFLSFFGISVLRFFYKFAKSRH